MTAAFKNLKFDESDTFAVLVYASPDYALCKIVRHSSLSINTGHRRFYGATIAVILMSSSQKHQRTLGSDFSTVRSCSISGVIRDPFARARRERVLQFEYFGNHFATKVVQGFPYFFKGLPQNVNRINHTNHRTQTSLV